MPETKVVVDQGGDDGIGGEETTSKVPTSLYLLSNYQQGDPKFSRRPRKSTGLHLICFGHFSGQVEHYLNKKECLQSMNCLALLWNDRKLSPHHCKEGDFSDKKSSLFRAPPHPCCLIGCQPCLCNNCTPLLCRDFLNHLGLKKADHNYFSILGPTLFLDIFG